MSFRSSRPHKGSGYQHRSMRGGGRPAQKKAVGFLPPVSLVLVLLLNASADLPFLFALMLGPGLKNINISLSADAASAARRSWEGVWEAWEPSPCPGARLPQRCCQPDGEIGAGASRHPPSCASAFGVRQERCALGPLSPQPPQPRVALGTLRAQG